MLLESSLPRLYCLLLLTGNLPTLFLWQQSSCFMALLKQWLTEFISKKTDAELAVLTGAKNNIVSNKQSRVPVTVCVYLFGDFCHQHCLVFKICDSYSLLKEASTKEKEAYAKHRFTCSQVLFHSLAGLQSEGIYEEFSCSLGILEPIQKGKTPVSF